MTDQTSTTDSKDDNFPKECRFAIHLPTHKSPKGPTPDLHLIKEIIHMPDGTLKPNIRFVKNRKRSFWVTQPQHRVHEQKREYEEMSKLSRFECTQSDLDRHVANALGQGYSNARLQQLSASPYLYGSDISSSALIKHEYAMKWPDAISPYRVAFFDTETDMIHGTEDPIVATLLFEKRLCVIVQEQFLAGYVDPLSSFQRMNKRLIQDMIDKHGLEVEFLLVKDTVELIKESFIRLHAWSPDFVAIWNIDFDIPRILQTLAKYHVDPKDIFSDPRLPPELRFCKYKKGSTKKVTASGVVKPKNPSEQWHSLYAPAGFYIICAMCSYRFIRQGSQEEQSYSLDDILRREKVGKKLDIPGMEAFPNHNADWHVEMQLKHHFEYLSYASVDVIGMLDLELATNDLSQALPVQAEYTDFSRFNSQTKRFADSYTFFLLEQNCVVGTIPPRKKDTIEDVDPDEELAEDEDDVEDEDSEEATINEDGEALVPKIEERVERTGILSLRHWIVTLPAHLTILGKKLIKYCDQLCTLFRTMVYDSDAVGAYPSAAMVANVSRETTVRELISIEGIDETVFRRHNLNLLQGHVNALEYGNVMHGLPTPQEALKFFDDME